MGPPMRQEVLLGVGALLLLLLPTTAYTGNYRCPSREYFFDEDTDKCQQCKLCLKNSREILQECQNKNPNVTMLDDLKTYRWCSSTPRVVRKKENELIVKAATAAPSTQVIGSASTRTPTTGLSTTAILGITIPIVLLVVAFCAICLLCWYRGRGSRSSTYSSPSSSGQTTPLTKRSDMSDIECGLTVERESKICPIFSERMCPTTTPQPDPPIPIPAIPPFPSPIEVEIKALPGHTINEGDSLWLDVSHVWSQSVVWFHDLTRTVLIGPKIHFESIAYFQRGTYLACNCNNSASIVITVNRRSSHRIAEENDEPQQVLSIREPVEIGPEPVEMAVAVCLPMIDIEQVPQHEAITSQPSDAYVQPETADGPAIIVPSGEIHRVVNVIDRLLIEVNHGRHPPPGCTLLLSDVLENEVAMQQLAIMVDTSSTWRIFAATKANMDVDEIEFVRHCTRGTGNTVKGLFKFIIENKNRADLTAADFSTSMRDARWAGCDKIIHLLFSLHPECPVCQRLHNSHGPSQMQSDARLQRDIPGFQYHLNNRFYKCSQTLHDLVRLKEYSEEFRQKSPVYFCQGTDLPVWRAVGSDLGGMSTELLNHLEFHYWGTDSYLKMLDFLVQLYPQLQVGTFAEWLRNNHYSSAKDIVLKYHKKNGDCGFCRQFAQKS